VKAELVEQILVVIPILQVQLEVTENTPLIQVSRYIKVE